MSTKIIMISSAVFLGFLGVFLTFLPNEIMFSLSIVANPISTMAFQLLGAIYLGFALLNWMAKGSRIGGIYNKPIAIGNFMHFGAGALALIKIYSEIQVHLAGVISLTIIYAVFAILFGYIFQTNPSDTV